MTRKPAPARAPIEADFEEDTLLPPPAPGLLPPTADHGFDPPTLPGLGARAVAGSAPADPAAPLPTSKPIPVPVHEALLSWPPVDGPAPIAVPERFERTLRMPLLGPLRVKEPPLPKDSGSAIALPPPPEVAPSIPEEVVPEATRPMRLGPSLDPTEQTLPPLPPVPARDTLFARLRYAITVGRSLHHRRQLGRQVQGEIARLMREYERGLVQLGQRAYADSIDPLTQDPRLSGEWEDAPFAAAPPKPTETVLRRDAERAAARYQAVAQKELAAREQRTAGLASELRAHSKRRRQLRANLMALDARAQGLPLAHPLAQQRLQTELELGALESKMREVAQRLGAARAEVQIGRRTQRHTVGPRLALALSPRLCALLGQAPHLLVLGSIVAGMQLVASETSERSAAYARLYHQLEGTQAELASRHGLLARLDGDLLAYDREALRRMIGAGALIVAVVIALIVAAWVLGG
jgi:hypothetical protein